MPYFEFNEIADAVGCSETRARHIYSRALRKCHTWCQARGYRLGDLLPDGDATLPGEYAIMKRKEYSKPLFLL